MVVEGGRERNPDCIGQDRIGWDRMDSIVLPFSF